MKTSMTADLLSADEREALEVLEFRATKPELEFDHGQVATICAALRRLEEPKAGALAGDDGWIPAEIDKGFGAPDYVAGYNDALQLVREEYAALPKAADPKGDDMGWQAEWYEKGWKAGHAAALADPKGGEVVAYISEVELNYLRVCNKAHHRPLVWNTPTGSAGIPLFTRPQSPPMGEVTAEPICRRQHPTTPYPGVISTALATVTELPRYTLKTRTSSFTHPTTVPYMDVSRSGDWLRRSEVIAALQSESAALGKGEKP